ncbi:hypothetical protein RHGRI_023042 [Rhododendron griersonianum]|uniref:Uncharacterized protein n=1 Tax=Rhododendron griersonianum TaxID=479676 RepID=A0AAV6J245_9ERIC|nr:hypothetical protein RHGRI_023042 [Rhododendron griersonianum]
MTARSIRYAPGLHEEIIQSELRPDTARSKTESVARANSAKRLDGEPVVPRNNKRAIPCELNEAFWLEFGKDRKWEGFEIGRIEGLSPGNASVFVSCRFQQTTKEPYHVN